MSENRLSTGEIGALIQRDYGCHVPDWKVSRVIEVLESQGKLNVQRFMRYRTVAEHDVDVIVEELRREGRMPALETVEC